MKFPRQARVFRGQLDAAPFAGVFFLLLFFVLLQSSLVYTPGIKVDLSGFSGPVLILAMSYTGITVQYFVDSQVVPETQLKVRLQQARRDAGEDLALVLQPDKSVPAEKLYQVMQIAQKGRFKTILLG